MKQCARRIGAVAVVVACAAAFGFPASDVRNSRHNLSSTAGTGQITNKSTNEDEICIFCHTPHQANPAAPLWNHTQSGTATYGIYSSPTMNATPTDIGGGTDVSNLCMSCHDGTMGINNLVNFANDTGANPTMGSGTELDINGKILGSRSTNLGSDLTNDHPVNFTYDGALATADGELATPSSTSWVDPAHTIPLFSARVQCASCHDAHDNTYPPFLVRSNTGSTLCKTCHLK